MRRLKLSGRVFGRLTVIKDAGNDCRNRAEWLCRCACGTMKVIFGGSLTSGATTSCGCLHREIAATQVDSMRAKWVANPKHGHARKGRVSPEYSTWISMIDRCTNPNSSVWKYYGGRGIQICERWRTNFASFVADMGNRPTAQFVNRKRSLYSIDRFPNKNGNYEPGNCRWATQKQQVQNSRPKGSR